MGKYSNKAIDTGGAVAKSIDEAISGKQVEHCGRINLAVTPENMQYIKTMSKISGRSMTNFINYVIDEYREKNAEAYNMARDAMRAAGIGGVDE